MSDTVKEQILATLDVEKPSLDGDLPHEKYLVTETNIEMAVTALAVYPTLELAQRYLKEHGFKADIVKLRNWRDRRYRDRYLAKRKELGPQVEAHLADDVLINAQLATETERLLIKDTHMKARKGEISDPARAARDLSQIRSQAIDKRLSIQGRPQHITERRDLGELLDRLVLKGVLQEAPPTPELIEGTDDGRAEDTT